MEFFKGLSGLYFLGVVTLVGIAIEFVMPWRKLRPSLGRWGRNAAISVYGIVVIGALPWLAGYGGAVLAQQHGAGILNWLQTPLWIGFIAAIIIVDLAAFFLHRVMHIFPFLWRIHRTHHSDAMIDTTTSLRFHPFETMFRSGAEFFVVYAFGLPPEGLLLTYGVFVVINVYTHVNLNVPARFERALSHVFITTRVHRLHHAVAPSRQGANFGTLFSLWDKLGGTWIGPEELEEDEAFGVDGDDALARDSFANLLIDPFRGPPRRSDREYSSDQADAS